MAERELLRFLTAGSVDDGKSTLIGRLLHDTHSIYQDQFAALRAASAASGNRGIDFSLVTDGLRAEREQGITIDVAYRYFSTPRRKFIIADTPGHEQYTRNMATGASTASLAVLLMDARKGVLPQTRRHAAIAWLLGIRNFAVAVNKMDLAGFDERIFLEIQRDFTDFMVQLAGATAHFIPTCSIDGDNVVSRSARMPWFSGMPLLEYLETVPVSSSLRFDRLRFPVQYISRAAGGSRRYAGQIASGVLRSGDQVLVLPSGKTARVESIRIGDREIDAAFPPLSISVGLEGELDIGRGDMLVDAADAAGGLAAIHGDAAVDERSTARNRARVSFETHDAAGVRERHAHRRGAEPGDARSRTGQPASSQRVRRSGDRDASAAVLRSLCGESRDRSLYRDRSAIERDPGRCNDHGGAPGSPAGAAENGRSRAGLPYGSRDSARPENRPSARRSTKSCGRWAIKWSGSTATW